MEIKKKTSEEVVIEINKEELAKVMAKCASKTAQEFAKATDDYLGAIAHSLLLAMYGADILTELFDKDRGE